MLVYVSQNYTADGEIREEYIARMEKATSDAVALGVSKAFVDRVIVPYLEPRSTPPEPPIPAGGQEIPGPGRRYAQDGEPSSGNEVKYLAASDHA